MIQSRTALRAALALGASAAALLTATSAFAQDTASDSTVIEELVVTAQRREQSIQDVPIAVSAFSQDTLKAQRLETGQDLLLAIPNVNFARGNFGGFNFQIRGIGTKLVATSADAAIGVHLNNIPVTAYNLADTEFFDVQRVEVLRGPQGTQFGRNTTGGLVNVITNRPTDEFEGRITAELGNYDTRRVNAFINLPMSDELSARVAGFYLKRSGFGFNTVTNNDIDNRDLWATRVSLKYEPNDTFSAVGVWEHFEEHDNRARVGKQLCVSDPGLTSIGGVAANLPGRETGIFFSQGCQQTRLTGRNALGAVNTQITSGGGPLNLFGIQTGDANAGKIKDPNLRKIEAVFDPLYDQNSDIFELLLNWKLSDSLALGYSASLVKTKGFSQSDYTRSIPTVGFNPNVSGVTDAEGFIDDPQVGRRNRFTTIDFSAGKSKQQFHEVRLQSSYEGPLNFVLGGNFSKFETQTDYYVTSNSLTATAQILNLGAGCPKNGNATNPACIYIDPNPIPDGSGGNYFDSRTKYQVTSQALYGEVYYNFTDDLRLTAGLRYTNDHKIANPFQSALLVPGQVGVIPLAQQRVTFKETTGRLNLEWSPDLEFTDKSLFYASYSRGYKGGGFNPPPSVGLESLPQTFAPEFIDAFEIGTKNTLLGGSLVLNATGFYYDYKGYQVSSIIQRTSINVNIDAEIYGAEFEAIWEPVQNLRFNSNIGYLHTSIKDSESLDLMNLTQGNADYQTLKAGFNLNYNNCIAPVAQLAALQQQVNAGVIAPIQVVGTSPALTALVGDPRGVCGGAFLPGQPLAVLSGVSVVPFGLTATNYTGAGLATTLDGFDLTQPGIPAQLKGNKLPNSPSWTISVGAQYTWEMASGWEVTPRADLYWQDKSYARIFNASNDVLESYKILNLSLIISKPDWDLNVQGFIRNVTNEKVVTDHYTTDDASGLFTNIFLTEPRTYGISVSKSF